MSTPLVNFDTIGSFMLTGRQIAAARTLLGLTQAQLAAAANISVPTLKRMEGSDGNVVGLRNNVSAVQGALESAGVTFIDDHANSAGGGPGVRLSASPEASVSDDETIQYKEYLDPDASGGSGG